MERILRRSSKYSIPPKSLSTRKSEFSKVGFPISEVEVTEVATKMLSSKVDEICSDFLKALDVVRLS